jgi:hypothetical protein
MRAHGNADSFGADGIATGTCLEEVRSAAVALPPARILPMPEASNVARRLWEVVEPIHVVTYFSEEAHTGFADAGYKGFWMGYFAGRAAPLGQASPELVAATFYNFSLPHISRAIPDAWSFAPPRAAIEARQRGATYALRRAFSQGNIDLDLRTVVELARKAAESAPMEGRPLFAANRALLWPEDPVTALWHACTLLREHRGDGHIAALVAAGIGGRQANVLQTAADNVPRDVFTTARHYDDLEWRELSEGLFDRGLLDADGRLTERGLELRSDVEDRTDQAALTAYESLDTHELGKLMELLPALARAVVETGDIPDVTPIGPRFLA